jgi:hypothetical protein
MARKAAEYGPRTEMAVIVRVEKPEAAEDL